MILLFATATAADKEYFGKVEPALEPDDDGTEQVVFKPVRDLSKVKIAKPPNRNAVITAGRLYHALSDKSAILCLLIEPDGSKPYLLADLDLNNSLEENETFELKPQDDNPYILGAVLNQPLEEGPFRSFPLLVRYFKNVKMSDLGPDERMILESPNAYARGVVDIEGRGILVRYSYSPRAKKVTPNRARLGVDSNNDGEIDSGQFSAEAAEANDETVIFRVGEIYVSTKRVDLEKNQITMKSHPASDYKRIDLEVGREIPDFEFTDFLGKKRRLSEFRGKYVLVDFWGTWCPPCRAELPYLKEAYQRYQSRGLEILGMNTDEMELVPQVRSLLEKHGMTWPQAKKQSIVGLIGRLRIHSYPTTILLGPDGKVLSMNNVKRAEPALRGQGLLRSLDRLLPP